MPTEIHIRASEQFNSLPDKDRQGGAGLAYSLAQLTTIKHIRQTNKAEWQSSDRKLAAWQKNIEKWIDEKFLEVSND